MSIEAGIIIGILTTVVSVGSFFIARLKDAEERGALKQRVIDLERRQDKTDSKMDVILSKLDEIGIELSELINDHRHYTKEHV